LNAIAGLVREDRNDAAVSMIARLSNFLRRVMQDSDKHEVTLGEEMEFLNEYLDIQKVRFAERLQVTMHVPEELLAAQIPSLLLQPIVENAVKHGIGKLAPGGEIRISAHRLNGTLHIGVYNDGPSVPADWAKVSQGIGISNLRTRLQSLYGDAFQFEMRNLQPNGVEALIAVPYVAKKSEGQV
jgi:two-component system, LytTR family, sensor kinase